MGTGCSTTPLAQVICGIGYTFTSGATDAWLADATEIAIEIVAGRDASANFDMQSLATLLHGDRIVVSRSQYRARPPWTS